MNTNVYPSQQNSGQSEMPLLQAPKTFSKYPLSYYSRDKAQIPEVASENFPFVVGYAL